MRLLLVTPEYPPYMAGISNIVHSIGKCLERRGISVDVFKREHRGIFNLPGLAGLVPFWIYAMHYIKRVYRDYDAVWVHSPISPNVLPNHIRNLIVTFHSTYYGLYKAYKEHGICHLLPYYFFASKIERFFLKKLSHSEIIVTAVSPTIAEELSKNGLTIPVKIIPNGVSIQRSLRISDRNDARNILNKQYDLNISKDDFILLSIARISEVKQPLLLVKLFNKISHLSKLGLIMLGTGNLLKKLKRETRSSHNFYLIGEVPHKKISVFMLAANAFISVSCYEGLGLSVLESLAHGLPAVLSNIPSHKFILKSRMDCGVFLDSRRPSSNFLLDFIKYHKEKQSVFSDCLNEKYFLPSIIPRYISLIRKARS